MNSTSEPEAAPKCTFLDYIEKNPIAAVIQAVAAGFAVGMIFRLLERGREKEQEIDVRHKPTLDDAKFHLGSLLLPLLWPAWQKAREGYGKSAGSVRETLEKVRESDLSAEGKRRLKKAGDWAEREAGHLSETGIKKAKALEEWVEEEILPAAEQGWKRLRKLFR